MLQRSEPELHSNQADNHERLAHRTLRWVVYSQSVILVVSATLGYLDSHGIHLEPMQGMNWLIQVVGLVIVFAPIRFVASGLFVLLGSRSRTEVYVGVVMILQSLMQYLAVLPMIQ